MNEIDPILLNRELQDTLRRYLLTTLPISDRFPKLRAEAHRQLGETDKLVAGPFVEAISDFEKGKSLSQLVEENVLHSGFGALHTSEYERPMHKHQEEAIHAICGDHNTVVATGTGSGKTECFIYPIIQNLLSEKDLMQKVGVRVLLVYPLNALANDQLYYRLVPQLVDRLKDYGITVGRYTGQTNPRWERGQLEEELLRPPEMKERFPDGIPPTWKLTRAEMLAKPPHVLVTNYAMLEHLLLLPRNAPLFSQCDLRILVLDEIHTYRGAQATEIAFLLRKLKNRFARDHAIRCIGTSANLSASKEERENILKFASDLFGEKFETLITGKRKMNIRLSESRQLHRLTPADWIHLHEIFVNFGEQTSPKDWNQLVGTERPDLRLDEDKSLSAALTIFLAGCEEVRKTAKIFSQNKTLGFRALSKHLFCENPQGREALKALIRLATFARWNPQEFPLLPARYHFFVSGVEDATVALDANATERFSDRSFSRNLDGEEKSAPRYRILTCRRCGEIYFEGFELNNHLYPQRPPNKKSTRRVFWLNPHADRIY